MSGRGHGPGVALFSLSPRLRGSGALCQTKVRSYVRPRPHAHARTPTPVTNRLPLYLPNCSRLPHRTPDRLLKRFVCAGWHTFATYRSANVAARPFGSQLGKCFDNRSARLFASIVCLELIGYCLWLWLNQSGVFAVCLTYPISLPFILPTFFAV